VDGEVTALYRIRAAIVRQSLGFRDSGFSTVFTMLFSPYTRNRVLLFAGTIICGAMFWWLGQRLHFPYRLSASLMQQPAVAVLLMALAVVFFAATLVGITIAGTVRFDAGIFCACLGMTVLSLRGGTMRDVLFQASDRNVFWKLAVEAGVLGLIIWCAWQLQWMFFRRGWLKEDSDRDGVIVSEDAIDQKALAFCAQLVVSTVLLLLLGQSDQKRQVLAAVGFSSFIGTIAAYFAAPTQPSVWYWIGPIVVAIIGYLAAMVTPAGLEIGDPRGPLANLIRPLPLDYASIGTAGSILGYWMSRRWQRQREDAEEEQAEEAVKV
jgi:hypothetical protein